MASNRRQFISSALIATGSAMFPESVLADQNAEPFPISCNQYDWITFYQRDGKDWFTDLDASLADFASTGIKAYEPSLSTVEDVVNLLPLIKKHKLSMPSVYVNSLLHEHDEGQRSIQTILSIADTLKPIGTKIVVTNPNPIQWGGPQNKSDTQLSEQARNLDLLGKELRKRGITLAYHTHDIELRAAGREFHHMLLATNPQNVFLCLDVHWVYRGSGDSQIALFDIVKLYGQRIVELHLRQSIGGIWQETFGEGDIDYKLLIERLKEMNIRPHFVIEQCLEKTSPKTMNAREAHKIDLKYVSQMIS